MLLHRGHKAQIRAAPAKGHPQRLPLTYGHIGAAVSGGLENGGGNGVHPQNIQSAPLMDDLTQRLSLLQLTEEVGLLDVHAGDVAPGQHLTQGFRVRAAVLHGDDTQLVAGAVAVGADGVDGVRVGRSGDQRYPALAVPAHGGGLSGGSGAVIDGGIGHVHARQLADHGLILEDGLQNALAHLRLIGGVGGEELLLGGDILHQRGDVVVIGSGAPENGGVGDVPGGHSGHGAADLQLAHALRQVQPVPQQHLLRHVPVQLAEVVKADGLQHLLPLGGRGGNIASHISPPAGRRPRSRRRPAAPPWR